MTSSRPDPGAAVLTAMICAGAVSAQFIAGKATRDALYLGALDVTSLPVIIMATALLSIVLVALSSRTLRRISPTVVIPLAFAANAVLLLIEWLLADAAPEWTARAVYLQVSGLGPMLGSGFWLIATDLFDPRTARRNFGQIAGVGTLSGLIGALIAERVAVLYGVTAMLPVLAALSLLCAWQIRRLASWSPPALRAPGGEPPATARLDGATDLVADSPQLGLRALSQVSYLRNLAALVVLGTIAAALADYVFKVRAVESFGNGDGLLRFFALYYAATSLLAFVIQTTTSAVALEKLGLAVTASTPSIALAAGGVGAILIPGLEGTLAARAGESVFRGSLFRTGYELFFTPIPSTEKRAAKSIIDVGFDRLGDAVGGGIIRLLIVLLPIAQQQTTALLTGAVLCSLAALLVASRLNQGYINTLERSLINRAVELDLGDVEDITTRTAVLRTLQSSQFATRPPRAPTEPSSVSNSLAMADPEMRHILALRSRDRARVLAVLRDEDELSAALVAHVVPLLAWDPVAEDAGRALRRVIEPRVGELTDALVDPNQPFAIRRRLARVFATGVSQRAADALMLGLDDLRFEVRFHCGRSLAAILSKNSRVRIDAERIFQVVSKEVNASRSVWESHRLLDTVDEEDVYRPFVDEVLKDRSNQSLGHVFTLLALVLPAQPLQIAYRGLHTDDPGLRGTALEYLEGVLPTEIRNGLWPILGDSPRPVRSDRSRDEILADLLRSNESIVLNLEELRRRAAELPRK